MTEPAAKKYHHGDLKNALIRAGMAMLEEDGLASLSLRALAARVGVSHTAPKNHFGSVKGVMTAIAAEGFRRFAAEMRAGLTDAAGREDRLAAAALGYVRFATGHPELFKVMFSPDHCEPSDPALRAAAAESYAVLAEISRGLDWQHAASPNAQWRAEILLWSIVHGYATLANTGQLQKDPAGLSPPGILEVMPAFFYRDEDAR